MTFDELVDLGVYDEMDDNGDIVWCVNMEAAKRYAPEIYYAELDAIDTAILEAIEAGYLEMDFTITEDGELDTTYKVLPAGLEAVK